MRQRPGERRDEGRPVLAAWMLPLIVAALAVSIVGGFYLGGPGLGLAVGALAAATIVVTAVRHPPPHPIVPAPLTDLRRHTLRSFPATEVILVTGSPESDAAGNAAVPELRSRLRADFHHLVLDPREQT